MNTTKIIQLLTQLYKEEYKKEPDNIQILPPAGSDRRYVRFDYNSKSVIGVYNKNRLENNTFFYFSRVFEKSSIPAPQLYFVGEDKQTYFIEDLGSESLFDILKKEGFTKRVKTLYQKAIDQLVRLHWSVGSEIDYEMCFSSKIFDKNQILSDLLYFKYYFVDLLKIEYNKPELLQDLKDWSEQLATLEPKTFMYRDFQSRNIMVQDEEVFFIDYQGAMKGLPHYDLASLLWQARAELPEKEKTNLLNYYFAAIKKLPEKIQLNEIEFRKIYLECVLLRILQTLGAYGYRGLIERKEHFLKSIVPALSQLKEYLNNYSQVISHVELENLLAELVKAPIFNLFKAQNFLPENIQKLKVKVISFSYKNGLPEDKTGNGGGYIFDCRGIHNPGRYEPYKTQTGKDESVKDFLRQESKINEFLKYVFSLVDLSIDDYLSRGFENLMIGFGCTGGQHRSVFSAEALTEHLQEKYNLNVELIHREEKNWPK